MQAKPKTRRPSAFAPGFGFALLLFTEASKNTKTLKGRLHFSSPIAWEDIDSSARNSQQTMCHAGILNGEQEIVAFIKKLPLYDANITAWMLASEQLCQNAHTAHACPDYGHKF
jgi:hypothetical protein